MTDPKEKEEQQPGNAGGEQEPLQSQEQENSNWDKHQQIDEEGNEVGPDDIK